MSSSSFEICWHGGAQKPGSVIWVPEAASPGLAYVGKQVVDRQALPSSDLRALALGRTNQVTYDGLAECLEHGVDVHLIAGARIGAMLTGRDGPGADVEVRRRQHARLHSDPEVLVRSLVQAKTANQRRALRLFSRRFDHPSVYKTRMQLGREERSQRITGTVSYWRGIEGRVAMLYFSCWPALLDLPSGFRRAPRTGNCPINALLDVAYSRLCALVCCELAARGLDLGLGALHVPDDRRPSLALDLMEPLRPLIADRFIVGLLHTSGPAERWCEEGEGRWRLAGKQRPIFERRWRDYIFGRGRKEGQLWAICDTADSFLKYLETGGKLILPAMR